MLKTLVVLIYVNILKTVFCNHLLFENGSEHYIMLYAYVSNQENTNINVMLLDHDCDRKNIACQDCNDVKR